MGNGSGKLRVINNDEEVIIVDNTNKDIRIGSNKEAVGTLYYHVMEDIRRSITADNYVRFTSKVGKEKVYNVLGTLYKVNFSCLK